MKFLEIDLETFSEASLPKVGVYRYVDDPSFEIILFSYSIDGGEVKTIDTGMGEKIPPKIINALTDPAIIKLAFNAQFERTALATLVGHRLDPVQWHDSMVMSNEMSLPAGLGNVAKYLGLGEQKDTRGKALIRYFSVPCKPTKANGGRKRNLPRDAPDKWAIFKSYNNQDVKTELAIDEALRPFPVPKSEWSYYTLDQQINDRCIRHRAFSHTF